MERLRITFLVAIVAIWGVSAYGQDVVGGSLGTRFAYGPATNATSLILDTPFNADGVVNTVTVDIISSDGTATPCTSADAFTIRVFREGSPGYSLVAERGPFAETLGTQVITLSSPMTVQRGDILGFYTNGSSRCLLGGAYGSQYRSLYIPADYRGGTIAYFVQSTRNGYSIRASSSPTAYVGTLAGAGVTGGAAGAAFNTLITMVNSGAGSVALQFAFRPFGTSGSAPAATASVTLGARSAKTMKFQELFPGASIGSVDVYSSGAAPVVNARVYNEAGTGTNGFTEPMLTPGGEQLAHDLDNVWLTMPADFDAFRMNVGVRALSAGARLTCEAINPSGSAVASISKDYPANWSSLESLQGFFDGNAAAVVPGGSIHCVVAFNGTVKNDVIVYGTVTDNRTNDSALYFAEKH